MLFFGYESQWLYLNVLVLYSIYILFVRILRLYKCTGTMYMTTPLKNTMHYLARQQRLLEPLLGVLDKNATERKRKGELQLFPFQ